LGISDFLVANNDTYNQNTLQLRYWVNGDVHDLNLEFISSYMHTECSYDHDFWNHFKDNSMWTIVLE